MNGFAPPAKGSAGWLANGSPGGLAKGSGAAGGLECGQGPGLLVVAGRPTLASGEGCASGGDVEQENDVGEVGLNMFDGGV